MRLSPARKNSVLSVSPCLRGFTFFCFRSGSEQVIEVFGGERRQCPLGVERRGGEPALARLQFKDALFDRAGGDQLIDKDRLVLADAVSTVGRLVFHSR